ncbi:hypothetical protein FA227_19690 [Pseudomonas aeruginosa]|nr:hypothetical protein [Pseudomonas aeruginosa]MCO3160877.1 hypothetical protein [Pseudomonas aeruginosa]RTA67595.1 hypothetical protein EJ577_20465 [Pseudomonas aeruginosa]HBP6714809.1 hypothetical protein [Pseudomonas aeruginosa]HBP6718754.1 hypothetical protein [Pseudomonas aeruginosa]
MQRFFLRADALFSGALGADALPPTGALCLALLDTVARLGRRRNPCEPVAFHPGHLVYTSIAD